MASSSTGLQTTGQQFIRASNLFLVSDSQTLDLSNLRFKFKTTANDVETPNLAQIRVYNLADQTLKSAINEYQSVIINAGYQGNSGTIFKGSIKQFRIGKESNVDSFLDIYAADADVPYNFATINATLQKGYTPTAELNALANAMGVPLNPQATSILQNQTGGIIPSPRGKVMFGMVRSYMRDLANTYNCRWSLQNGVLTLIPLDSYLPGTAVKLNSSTGMVGVPEATDQGIQIQALINPRFAVGGQVQLNNKDITATVLKQQFFPGLGDISLVATVAGQTQNDQLQTSPVDSSLDGFYRILVIEHEGDTRGDAWYSNLTCLNINPGVAADESVLPYGIPQ
jgi:hypothetical protein